MTRPYISNFHVTYDSLVHDILGARHQFIAERLQEWFAILDETPDVSRIISRLEEGLDFKNWFGGCENSGESFEGNGKLTYPPTREGRLGMQLKLFRAVAQETLEAWELGHTYTYAGSNMDANAQAFIQQVFHPLQKDLLRHIDRQLENMKDEIPASDRVVRIDHNSPSYREAEEALDNLEHGLQSTNEFPGEPEEKDQFIAEVSAARRLLQAARVRIVALVELLKPLLVQFVAKVKDGVIATLATAAVAAIVALLGHIFG